VVCDQVAELGAERGPVGQQAEGVSWLPKSRYLSVSGRGHPARGLPSPRLSGQVQHMVGVNGATTIVAINKDKTARSSTTAT
jgi:electron transfer flavoprotein alpha subunit